MNNKSSLSSSLSPQDEESDLTLDCNIKMPTKTKKQKLRTVERKKSEFLKLNNKSVNFTPQQIINTTIKANPSPNPVTITLDPAQQKLTSYFFTDLKKSLIFIVCIIALEFILYFVSIKG